MAVSGRAALAILMLAGISACTKAQARVPGPAPVLDTPAPPDRLIVPSTLPPTVETPPAASPPPPAPQQPPRQTASNTRPPDKPPTAPPPVQPQPETSPPPVLQTTANVAGLEQEVLRMIGSAERDLSRVVFASLSHEGKRDFETARGFITQAQRNLKIKNFSLAQQQAYIAATLAGALVKR